MSSSIKLSSSIYLLPGMTAKLYVSDFFVGHGQRKIVSLDGTTRVDRILKNGWAVVDEDTGTIEPVSDEPAVLYTQKKFGLNKIYFYARTGEVAYVDVLSVPIHDHSSIVSGGPAYGTYFTDEEGQ